jgi:SAM-dependent methyltransferase
MLGATAHILRAVKYRVRTFRDHTLFDKWYGIETSLAEKENLWNLGGSATDDFRFYQAIKWRHLRQMIRSIPESSLDEFTFIDIGCGKGRALLLASKFGFQRILGLELSSRLVAVAKTNISKYQRRTGIRVPI